MQRWIVVADGSRAAVYVADNNLHLNQLQYFENPQGRAQNRELVSDAHGRYYGKGERYQGHVAEPDIDAVQHQQELFARQVSSYINSAVLEKRCTVLSLVAAPAFLGLLRPLLHKQAQHCVEQEIAKDVTGRDIHELATWLRQQRS